MNKLGFKTYLPQKERNPAKSILLFLPRSWNRFSSSSQILTPFFKLNHYTFFFSSNRSIVLLLLLPPKFQIFIVLQHLHLLVDYPHELVRRRVFRSIAITAVRIQKRRPRLDDLRSPWRWRKQPPAGI